MKVAEGIVAFIPPESRTRLVSGNSTVIIGDDGVVVVDSGQFPTLARRQIAEIKAPARIAPRRAPRVWRPVPAVGRVS